MWLYFRFPLSFREVEELMLQRGVIVSYETIRRWSAKFGQAYANGLHRSRPRPGDMKFPHDRGQRMVTLRGQGLVLSGPWFRPG
ncbi:hypothetical protein TNCT6_78650 [Streptomyces sp. 6-11-2]|nr:hypothetical protein TNCT6_78650 [Streptomyces sp. 6-11-2]